MLCLGLASDSQNGILQQCVADGVLPAVLPTVVGGYGGGWLKLR